jgi:hypothetical protein
MDEIICMNADRNMSLLISHDNPANSISRQQTFVEPFFEYPSSVHMNPENCLLVLSQVDQNSKHINQSEVFKRSKIFISNPFSEVNIFLFLYPKIHLLIIRLNPKFLNVTAISLEVKSQRKQITTQNWFL